MMDIVLITPPPIEPVTLDEAKRQCGFGPIEDSDRAASQILADDLRGYIKDAREHIENWTRRALITQTWAAKCDSFPGRDYRYLPQGYAAFKIPKPPVQSIYSFQYIDVSGTLQTLLQDTTYGVSITEPQYGYQFIRGSETQGGQLIVSYPRIWPPTRMVPANVLIKFRCGYGGPLTVSTTASSAVISGPKFNPDDAPLLPLETGLAVSIPGAGASGVTLNTNIASVDGSGNATLAIAASTAVTGVTGWFGDPVPGVITRAIKLMVQYYYEQAEGYLREDLETAACNLVNEYRNFVS